jgi:adenylyltransferase/sulfurtransferase
MSDSADCPLEIDPVTVKRRLQEGREFLLLDCREPDEYAWVHIDEAQLIPMSELGSRLSELGDDLQRPIVVYCHHGGRSLRVAQWLRQQGWRYVQSMIGGIDAWSLRVDPAKPRYT